MSRDFKGLAAVTATAEKPELDAALLGSKAHATLTAVWSFPTLPSGVISSSRTSSSFTPSPKALSPTPQGSLFTQRTHRPD